MVECGGLENRLAGIPRYEGSNPSLSARRTRTRSASLPGADLVLSRRCNDSIHVFGRSETGGESSEAAQHA